MNSLILNSLNKNVVSDVVSDSLNITSGFEGLYGTSGLSLIYSGNMDDYFYNINIPFTFNFFGINYGNGNNGGVYVGTNGYITFGFGASQFYDFTASSPGRGLFFLSGDRRLFTLYAGSMSDIKGLNRYRVYWYGNSFSNTNDRFTVEIIFYSNGYIQLNYGTLSNTAYNGLGITNGIEYKVTWTVYSNYSIAINSNDTTITTGGYWS